MTKIHIFTITLAVFFSLQLHAGMEQTAACYNRVKALKAEIKSLQDRGSAMQTNINNLSAVCADLKTGKEKFSKLPLIPSFLHKMKQSSLDEKIVKVNGEIASLTESRRNLENSLQAGLDELRTEEAKLKNYRTITLKRVQIDAYGTWDKPFYTAPEIRVTMSKSVICRGAEDTQQLNASLYEDATYYDYLGVYDEDVNDWEYMGEIPLEKSKIPKGVSGDSFVKKLTGKVEQSSSRGFSYTVEYEVEY